VLLLLGLDLVTSADRLTGAPMLGVLCGALLIGRLGLEVGLGRWRQLTEEERQRLGSMERWSTSFRQLGITSAGLLERAGAGIGNLTAGIGQLPAGSGGLAGGAPARSGGKRKGKRWVRPETPAESPTESPTDSPTDDAGVATGPAGQVGGDAATTPGSQDAASSDSEPVAAGAVRAAAPAAPEPESSLPAPAADPAALPSPSRELESEA
jgi:isoleucyl-tRNA synthetase